MATSGPSVPMNRPPALLQRWSWKGGDGRAPVGAGTSDWGHFSPSRTQFEQDTRRFIKISAPFCYRYKAENICNSGITKFIEPGPKSRVSNRRNRKINHCEYTGYRNVAGWSVVASVVHS